MNDIFISYAREDLPLVKQIVGYLRERQLEVWVDLEGIYAGEKYVEQIEVAVEASNVVVFIISQYSQASMYCSRELDLAASLIKRVIPVAARDTDTGLPEALSSRQWIFARGPDEFSSAMAMLSQAIHTDPSHTRRHTQLLTKTREWERAKRDSSLLLRGRELENAEGWLAQASMHENPRPLPMQIDFIQASRRREKRQLRSILGSVTAGLILSLVLTSVALWQWQRSRVTELSARSLTLRDTQLDLAILLAAEALRHATIWGSIEKAKQSLKTCLLHQPSLVRFLHSPIEPIGAVAISPDGRRAATFDGTSVSIWPISVNSPPEIIAAPDNATSGVTFSRDGKHLIFFGRNIFLLSLTPRQLRRAPFPEAAIGYKQVEADTQGNALGAVDHEGKAWVWRTNADTVEQIASDVVSLSFHPDGHLVGYVGHNDHGGNPLFFRYLDGSGEFQISTEEAGEPDIYGLEFSPDGKKAASLGDEIYVWDLSTRKLVPRGTISHPYILSAAFTPDGHELISVGANGTILASRTWTPRNFGRSLGRPLTVIRGEWFSGQVALSVNSSVFVGVIGDRHTAVILRTRVENLQSEIFNTGGRGDIIGSAMSNDDLGNTELVEKARQMVGRTLTRSERERFGL